MNIDELLNLTRDQVAKIHPVKFGDRKRKTYPPEVINNIVKLGHSYPYYELSTLLHMSHSTVYGILTRNNRYHLKKTGLNSLSNSHNNNKVNNNKISKVKAKENQDIFKFIDITSDISKSNSASSSTSAFNIPKESEGSIEKKLFMKLTTPSGIIISIFN